MEATMPECGDGDVIATANQSQINQTKEKDLPLGNICVESRINTAVVCADVSVAAQGDERPNITKAKAATANEMLELIATQDYRCATCGIEVEPSEAEIDHIQPRSAGGSDLIENLQWLCIACNRAKRDMSLNEFIALCSRVAEMSLKNSTCHTTPR